MTIDEPEGASEAEQPQPQPVDETETPAAAEESDGVDDLVGGLFREVDDRFSHLAARFQAARRDLTTDEVESTLAVPDPVAASTERYQLVSEAAALRADVERQAAELDERDRMLAELGGRIVEFEERLRVADEAERAAAGVRQELHEERRELARVRALLDASAAEREELSEIAHRLQGEKDHLETLLATARERFEEVERVRAELVEDVARLETARTAETAQHEQRQEELTEIRAEARRLGEAVDELTIGRDEAIRRADKAESRIERRANEVNYLNRRIEALTERAAESDRLETKVTNLAEENTLLGRRVVDLEREVESQTAQAVAAAAAVEAIADRSAQHDELVARIAELEAAAVRREQTSAAVAASSEIQSLADRARALGAERTSGGYEPLASTTQAASAASAMLSSMAAAGAPSETAADPKPPTQTFIPEVEAPAVQAPQLAVPEVESPAVEAPQLAVPEVESPAVEAPQLAVPEVEAPAVEAPQLAVPDVEASGAETPQVAVPAAVETVVRAVPNTPTTTPESAPAGQDPAMPSDMEDIDRAFGLPGNRRRMVLPTSMQPDTAEAVAHLMGQPGVTAIVDARSFCGRTGVRPSELFERMEAMRDRFDVPVEVIITPVSTPVGGAPMLPAIGVHSITGADTVADRVRALCVGFPADQPLVVVAGDDHVRRAAIAEEANVVDPVAVLDVT